MPLLYSFFLTWFFNHCLESFAFRLKNFLYSCGSAVSELSQILFIWEWLYFTFNLKTISLDIKFLVDSSPHLLALQIMLSRSQGIHSLCFFTLWPHHAACGILAPSAWVLSRCPCVWPCVTPWAIAHQDPLSVGFSRHQHWSGMPWPPPGSLPNPVIKPRSPALQAGSLSSEPPGKPANTGVG